MYNDRAEFMYNMSPSTYFLLWFTLAYGCEINIYGNADGYHDSCKTDIHKIEKLVNEKFGKTEKVLQESKTLLEKTTGQINVLVTKIQPGLTKLETMIASNFRTTKRALQENNDLLRQTNELIKNMSEEQPLLEVAHGKIAKQSSTTPPKYLFTADKAVDGNASTFSHTSNEFRPYWSVDLGHEFTISRIEVFNRHDCCGERFHDVDVTIGPTMTDMKLCVNYKGPSKNAEHIVLHCKAPMVGRFV